jgi:hypothetical protein
LNRCVVGPAAAASGASSIHGTLHDANGRPRPPGPTREPPSTGARSVARTPRVDGQTGGSVDPNARVHPADGAGQEARGGGCHAWTGRTGGPRPSGRPHASPVVWPAAARTSTNSYGRNCGEPQGRCRRRCTIVTPTCYCLAGVRVIAASNRSRPHLKSLGPPLGCTWSRWQHSALSVKATRSSCGTVTMPSGHVRGV